MAANTVAEVAQELAVAAKVEAAETVAAIVDNANAQVAAAQETAQQIVEAAAQVPLAQAVAELQQDAEEAEEWESQVERQLAALELRVTELQNRMEQMMATQPPPVTIIAPQPEPSLIPQRSPVTVTMPEAEIVDPLAILPDASADGPPAAAPAKRRTRLI